jgi:hypothetical protein
MGAVNTLLMLWLFVSLPLIWGTPSQVFHQSGVVQEDAGWKDSLYRLYSSSASNMRVAVYGYKHDAGPYETLLKEFCQLQHLVGGPPYIASICKYLCGGLATTICAGFSWVWGNVGPAFAAVLEGSNASCF